MTPGDMRSRLRRDYAAAMLEQPLPPLPRASLARWREVSDALIVRASRLLPVAEVWLPALLNELDRRLDQPLEVVDAGPVRTITALGFVRYTIDRQARSMSSTMLAAGGPIDVDPAQFEVACAWARFGWLRPLLESLPAMRLIDTLLPETHRDHVMTRLAQLIEPLLKRDERLHTLRRQLRAALRFDLSLVRLALRTRRDGSFNGLSGARLIDVWRHEAHLRVVEKDAGRLLSLAYTVVEALAERPAAEAVKGLKALLKEAGMTDAGWRYLLRFGGTSISALGGGDLTLRQVAQLAQALALAGGHPPPSPALREAWAPRFTRIATHGAEHKDSIQTWLTTERRLASAILKAANEAKRTPNYARFVDDIACVLWWLRDAKIATPRQSLRTLIRSAKAWEADQLVLAQAGRRRWIKPRTVACPDERHEAVLLDGPAAVLEEARAMRNCLRARLPILRARSAQIWSVRRRSDGARVALIELRREPARWKLRQLAARFNRPAPAWVWAFAESLAACETARLESNQGAKQ